MGESKRRKASLGQDYGTEERMVSWLPLTKSQVEQAYKVTTRGAWIGIATLITVWLTIRFIGPAFGWWTVY
jgi:hypothetical protein